MENPEPHLLINDLEDNARHNIIKLDQKLRGLKAEIEAKLQTLNLLPEHEQETTEQGLTTLLNEIDQAIAGIKTLVGLVVVDEKILDSSEVKKLNKMVAENLEKVIRIKSEF